MAAVAHHCACCRQWAQHVAYLQALDRAMWRLRDVAGGEA